MHTDPERLDRRMDALEKRLDRLLSQLEPEGPSRDAPGPRSAERAQPPGAPPTGSRGEDDPFWALHGLSDRHEGGAVLFTGRLPTDEGPVEYQYGRPTDFLAGLDWGEFAERLAALGHPIRLGMLQQLLNGTASVAELVEALELGSTSVAYHHLGQLSRSGWVATAGRGRYRIPAGRIIPLLAVITAAES